MPETEFVLTGRIRWEGNERKTGETRSGRKNLKIKRFHFKAPSSQHLSEQSLTRNQNRQQNLPTGSWWPHQDPEGTPRPLFSWRDLGHNWGLGHLLGPYSRPCLLVIGSEPCRKVIPHWSGWCLSSSATSAWAAWMQRHLQTFSRPRSLAGEASSRSRFCGHGARVRRESSGSSLTPEGTSGSSLSWSQIGVLRCKSHRVTV